MNLIGHYVCAQAGSPWLQAGAVLPDLLSLHRRRARLPALLRAGAEGFAPRAAGEAIVQGLALHHEVDVRFHKDALFLRVSREMLHLLKAASAAPGLKRFLPAHVLTELWFDHLALQLWPGAGAGFQALLGPRRRGTLARFAARDTAVDAEAFEAFLAHLHARRFGEGYRDLGTVLARMNRVLLRFGQREFLAEEEAALRSYFAAEAERTRADVVGFVNRMAALCPPAPMADTAADTAEAGASGRLRPAYAT